MNTLSRGVWSGVLATGAMTISFFALFEIISARKRSPIPPATITNDLEKMAGIEQALAVEPKQNIALLSHFAYGSLFACLYSVFQTDQSENGLAKGVAFGFSVWGFSYLGLLPGLGARATAFKMPAEKSLYMIVNHLIWGTALGYTEQRLRLENHQMLDGGRHAPQGE